MTNTANPLNDVEIKEKNDEKDRRLTEESKTIVAKHKILHAFLLKSIAAVRTAAEFSSTSSCSHKYIDTGICKYAECGFVYDWEATLDHSEDGIYKLKEDTYPKRTAPYDADSSHAAKIKKGQQVYVIGKYKNAYGNYWYHVSLDNNSCYGYVYSGKLEKIGNLPSNININITYPTEGQTIAKATTNLLGNITSSVKITKVVTLIIENAVLINRL